MTKVCPHLMIQRNRVSFFNEERRGKWYEAEKKKEHALTQEVFKMAGLSLASVVLRLEKHWPY